MIERPGFESSAESNFLRNAMDLLGKLKTRRFGIIATILCTSVLLLVLFLPRQTFEERMLDETSEHGKVSKVGIGVQLRSDGAARISEEFTLMVQPSGENKHFGRQIDNEIFSIAKAATPEIEFQRFYKKIGEAEKEFPFAATHFGTQFVLQPSSDDSKLVVGEQVLGFEYEVKGLVRKQGIENVLLWDVLGYPLYVETQNLVIEMGMPRGTVPEDIVATSLVVDPKDTASIQKFIEGQNGLALDIDMNLPQDQVANYRFAFRSREVIMPPKRVLIRVAWIDRG